MNKTLQDNNGIPKYLQLKEILKKSINDLKYKDGDRFFSERDIMRRYKISSATVSHAMRELVQEGLIERKIGGGSFIRQNLDHMPNDIPVEDGNQAGYPTLTILMNFLKAEDRLFSINQFILSEIKRGIINTYQGKVNILSTEEYIESIKSDSDQYSVLVDPTDKTREFVKNKNIHHITIDHLQRLDLDTDVVTWDQMEGVYKLMKYLINDLGHKDVAIITMDNPTHSDRFAAYQIGLHTNGIAYDDSLVVKTDSGSIEDGYQATKKLLANKRKPTAIFADTDVKALGAIKAVKDAGLRVPEDVFVAGFDDIFGTGHSGVSLTTVKVPYFEMGAEAVKMINEKIVNSNTPLETRVLKTKLVIRDTKKENG